MRNMVAVEVCDSRHHGKTQIPCRHLIKRRLFCQSTQKIAFVHVLGDKKVPLRLVVRFNELWRLVDKEINMQ